MPTHRKRLVESSVRGAQPFGELLDRGLAARDFATDTAEYRLLCLTRPVRAAYLLGDVLGLSHTDGAAICEITPAAFRQRLARARRTVRHAIDNRCGLVDPANPCRCGRQIRSALDLGNTAVVIGELYRADRFAAPPAVWAQLQRACPDLFIDTGADGQKTW